MITRDEIIKQLKKIITAIENQEVDTWDGIDMAMCHTSSLDAYVQTLHCNNTDIAYQLPDEE